MITYAIENKMSTIEEIDSLGMFEQNFMEVDPRGLSSSFDMNWEFVNQLLYLDLLKIAVARNEYDRPIGYLIMTVAPKDLFCKEKVATTLCTYIDPSHRKGVVFSKLVKTMEEHLISLGVQHYSIGVMPELELSNHGYHLDNKVYSKPLTTSM